MAKTDNLVIRIDAELKERLRQAAEEDGRSISNYVLLLIRKALEQREA